MQQAGDQASVVAALAQYAFCKRPTLDAARLRRDERYLYDQVQLLKQEGRLNWKEAQDVTGVRSQRLYRYFYETIEYRLHGNSLTDQQKADIEQACNEALRQGVNIWNNKEFQARLKEEVGFSGHRVEFMVFINNLRRHKLILATLQQQKRRRGRPMSEDQVLDLITTIIK